MTVISAIYYFASSFLQPSFLVFTIVSFSAFDSVKHVLRLSFWHLHHRRIFFILFPVKSIDESLGGIGVASVLTTFYVSIYYNVILAWALVYLGASFVYPLPWSEETNAAGEITMGPKIYFEVVDGRALGEGGGGVVQG